MKKLSLLKKILLAIVVLVVVLVVIVSLQPNTFRIERSTTIAASAEAVFPHVNELRRWEAWNPWGKIDPNMKLTYDGPSAGVGASYAWVGNNDVGEGRATITEVRANEYVQLRLEFLKPMPGVAKAEFSFKPVEAKTQVTWAMSGTNNFIGRFFCLFMNMDKMVGGQFEKGLADLKAASETPAR